MAYTIKKQPLTLESLDARVDNLEGKLDAICKSIEDLSEAMREGFAFVYDKMDALEKRINGRFDSLRTDMHDSVDHIERIVANHEGRIVRLEDTTRDLTRENLPAS